jgi:HK97 family phage major capsid protein
MNLKLNKLAALVYVTDELLEDSSALGAWITTNLPEEMRFTVEDAMLRGTGVGMPLGILNSNSTVTVSKVSGQDADTLLYENLVAMWSRRYASARGGYVWMINQDVGPVLPTLNVTTGVGGALVYMPPGGISGAPYSTLFGAPVIETEYSSTLGDKGDVILAAWSEYQMIEKGGIQSASSIHVRFIYDETVFRFVYRVDGQPKWAEPLTPYQGTATVSPFVTLEARS